MQNPKIYPCFPFLQLREAMVAMRKSARDVAKFMDAVNKKTTLQEAQKGVGAQNGSTTSCFPAGNHTGVDGSQSAVLIQGVLF